MHVKYKNYTKYKNCKNCVITKIYKEKNIVNKISFKMYININEIKIQKEQIQ